MTKKEALIMFKEMVADHGNPSDNVSIRCAWDDYVDSLYRRGMVSEKQAMNWTNPFCK